MFELRSLKSWVFSATIIISVIVTAVIYNLDNRRLIVPLRQGSLFINGSLLNELYLDRLDLVTEVCGRNKNNKLSYIWNNTDFLDHVVVDSRHQLLYCYVPKVACTNWKRMFMVLSGNTNETNVLSIPAHVAHNRDIYLTLRNFTVVDAENLLNTYTKFLFVRHPFERLVSAYRNKLEKRHIYSKYFQSRLGRYIIKNYRVKPTNASLINGDDVTFDEFTAYLTKSPSSMYNEHWKPIHNLCEPCAIDYNFIGKYESIITDSDFLLKSIGINNVSFPHIKPSGTNKDLKKYFSTLSLERIKALRDIYSLDFKLFSYDLNNLLGYDLI